MNTLLISLSALLLSQCASQTTAEKTKDESSVTVQTTTRAENNTGHSAKKDARYNVSCTDRDKQLVNDILKKFAKEKASPSTLIVAIARELRGKPYVAKTLENDSTENLVVNLRQLDCTTYVENVLATYECLKNGRCTFDDFCEYLRKIRYVNGTVSYPSRQHYFTEWIAENTKDGFVKEVSSPNPPFTAIQHLRINFMSTHTKLYPMLKANPDMVNPIRDMEKRLSGNEYPYIPKTAISNSKLMRSTVHDGDIIAITTSKEGLDTSHIGIAVWHKDGLHMLNASQIHKKVVEEPMTLYQYMQKHPSQTGIRIIRVL